MSRRPVQTTFRREGQSCAHPRASAPRSDFSRLEIFFFSFSFPRERVVGTLHGPRATLHMHF